MTPAGAAREDVIADGAANGCVGSESAATARAGGCWPQGALQRDRSRPVRETNPGSSRAAGVRWRVPVAVEYTNWAAVIWITQNQLESAISVKSRRADAELKCRFD